MNIPARAIITILLDLYDLRPHGRVFRARLKQVVVKSPLQGRAEPSN
jgi:hypothetical protein